MWWIVLRCPSGDDLSRSKSVPLWLTSGTDSNNTAALGEETPLDINTWGPAFDFFVGREINDCWSAEGRVGFAFFDDRDSFSFAGSGASDAQNSFWITRIDGVQAGPPGPAQGITGGIRFALQADGTLAYDSEWYDFGIDFVRHVSDSCNKKVDYVIGPAFAHVGQNFQYDVGRKRFQMSAILDWFGEDFGDSQQSRLRRIADWLPTPNATDAARQGAVSVSYLDYDWNLNKQ